MISALLDGLDGLSLRGGDGAPQPGDGKEAANSASPLAGLVKLPVEQEVATNGRW